MKLIRKKPVFFVVILTVTIATIIFLYNFPVNSLCEGESINGKCFTATRIEGRIEIEPITFERIVQNLESNGCKIIPGEYVDQQFCTYNPFQSYEYIKLYPKDECRGWCEIIITTNEIVFIQNFDGKIPKNQYKSKLEEAWKDKRTLIESIGNPVTITEEKIEITNSEYPVDSGYIVEYP